MKFRITSTQCASQVYYNGGKHTEELLKEYPMLTNKVRVVPKVLYHDIETEIEVNSVDELIELVECSGKVKDITIRRDWYIDYKNEVVYKNYYTIELYDEYWE